MDSFTMKYKGFEIRFVEYDDRWVSGEFQHASLKKLKKWIDGLISKNFKKFDVYCEERWNSTKEIVTVTSKSEGEDSYWIKNKNGDRSKQRAKCLFKISKKNDRLFDDLKKLTDTRDMINHNMSDLKEKLETLEEK